MAEVWIPALLQDLTSGQARVSVPGATLREVIEHLEIAYPGIKARLVDQDQVRPGIAVIVDGEVSQRRLRHRLNVNSEIHFLPAISGGSDGCF